MMDGADEAAHREIVTRYRGEEAGSMMLCPDCYRVYQGMVDTMLSDGQDWASLWGTPTLTIVDNDPMHKVDRAQKRIDDEAWSREVRK